MAPFLQTLFLCALVAGMPSGAEAATLDVPAAQSTLSGIGVIHGWKCTAGRLTVRFGGRPPLPLLHGAARKDVFDAGACHHINSGFVSIMNWGELGDGVHTAVVYDDGVEFARHTCRVVTTGWAFHRGPARECLVDDFPDLGQQAEFVWDRQTQHMELARITDMAGGEEEDPTGGSSTDLSVFDFLFERDDWIIEVPGINAWKHVSADIDHTITAGDQIVPAPAWIEFMRRRRPTDPPVSTAPFFRAPVEGAEIAGYIHGTSVHGGAQTDGLSTNLALGGVHDMLPGRTAVDLGVWEDRYAMIVSVISPDQRPFSTYRCFVIVFNHVRRTDVGGLDTLAYFAITEKERGESIARPGACVNPLTPLYSTRLQLRFPPH